MIVLRQFQAGRKFMTSGNPETKLSLIQKLIDFCTKVCRMPEFKHSVYLECERILTDRIAAAKQAVEAAQESANSDEKSSAGDKFETGRAMGQLDRDMFARQYAQAIEDMSSLQNIKNHDLKTVIGIGTLVKSERGLFYIAVGLGKVVVDHQAIIVISPAAPVAKEMMGKKVGDSYMINQTATIIEVIW